MKLFKKILSHLIVFTALGLIYFIVIMGFCDCGILSIIYFAIIYALVLLIYYCVNKKTKLLTKRRNRIVYISLTTVTFIVLFGATFGTIDYIRAKNGKMPIFSLKSYGYTKQEVFLESDEDSSYSGFQYTVTEYDGLGYKVVVCDSCEKPVYFMPLGIGTYAWFIGMPVDKLNGQWFHANNNDIYMSLDGVGNYSFSNNKTTESGTYKLDGDLVVLISKNGDNIVNCTIKNNYHELHCDNYAEVFMK